MSVTLISLLFGLGVAGWVWSQVGQRTGNADQKTTLITAGLAGLMAFVLLFTILKFVLSF